MERAANAGNIMGEMDTDTIGLIVSIASVVAVLFATRREPRKASQDALASANQEWGAAGAAALPVSGACVKSKARTTPWPFITI